MIKSVQGYAVLSIQSMIMSDQIAFNHRLQRKVGQWSKEQKSLLIDSIIRGYDIGQITMLNEDNLFYVIDGIQRLSTINAFMRNEFALSKKLKPVYLKAFVHGSKEKKIAEFSIAGKKYDKLDDEVRVAIQNYQMTVNSFNGYTEDDVNEMFFRINNGTAMNKTQKSRTLFDEDLFRKITDALDGERNGVWDKFGRNVSMIKQDKDRSVLVQALYALSDEEVQGFKQDNLDRFVKSIQNPDNFESEKEMIKYQNKLFGMFYDITEVFDSVWVGKIPNMNMLSIAPIIAGAKGLNESQLEQYAEVVEDFFENLYHGSLYEAYCQGAGTAGKERVVQRIDFWKNVANDVKNKKVTVFERVPEEGIEAAKDDEPLPEFIQQELNLNV